VSSGAGKVYRDGTLKMSSKANRRGFIGRKQRRTIAMHEPRMEEERLPNPMKRDDWVRWLELQRELDLAEKSRFVRAPQRFCLLLGSYLGKRRSGIIIWLTSWKKGKDNFRA
jgi:hypothetical protein